jgi:xanthine dehydrogenase accessory factor
VAGENCDAVIETRRSHTLGRVYWSGASQSDSGQPDGDRRRVLRAPAEGMVIPHAKIGEHVAEGQFIAELGSPEGNQPILSPFDGMLRGLLHDGISVPKGMKIGDVDPRDDASMCWLVSDKALSIGGGVLEAVLSKIQA